MTTDWTDWFKTWDAFPSAPASNPWNATLEQWWRSFQHDRHDRPFEVMERMVSQGRSFFELCQQLASAGSQAEGAADWQKTVDDTLEHMKSAFAPSSLPASGFWQLPLENWQRAVSAMSGMPADYLSAFSGGEAESWRLDPQDRLDRLLGMPGVGYTRELQEQYQTLARLVIDYQQALEKYTAANAEMGRLSLDRLQQRLRTRASEGLEPVSSARELYDLWVECSEEVYGEYVRKEEYAILHGDLVNALMAVKHQGGKIMDEIAGMFNMPTRSEMETVHSRFQDSRRAVARLRGELEALREELLAERSAGPTADKAAMKTAQKELHARLTHAERLLGELSQRTATAPSKTRPASTKKAEKGKKSKNPKKPKKNARKAKKEDK